MLTIWKYPVPLTDHFSLEVPFGSDLLTFALDPSGQPCVWFRVISTNTEKEERHFALVGTGTPIPDPYHLYRGTVTHGSFVWHLFESDE